MATAANGRAKGTDGKFVKVNGVTGHTVISEPASNPDEPAIATDDAASEPETIAGFDTFDPANGSPDRGSGDSPRKRGRPKGSKNGTSAPKEASKNNLNGLDGVIMMTHLAVAKFFDCPELQLDEQETKQYALAVAKVNECYNPAWNPKAMAWMQLLIVVCTIYGTRLYAIRARHMAGPQRPAKVVDIKKSAGAPAEAAPNAQTPADIFGLNYSAALAHEM